MRHLLAMACLTAVAGCALPPAEPPAQTRREPLWAVTDTAELLRFNAGQPQKVLQRLPLRSAQALPLLRLSPLRRSPSLPTPSSTSTSRF